jgi:hypothetical protein
VFKTPSSIIRNTIAELEVMKKTGETIRPLPYGKNRDLIFVSSEKDALLAFDYYEHDEVIYFIGFKKNAF